MSTYNTNLAAEFHVLSVLHRLGAEASLTLGNKKAVDIIVSTHGDKILTIDVKGLAGSYDWPADNIRFPARSSHYVALLSYENKIADPGHSPSVWVVPAISLRPFVKKYRTRTVVSRALIKRFGTRYLHAWSPFVRSK